MCRFSIITVVKNNATRIKECINCVSSQSYKNFQHIVIDGKSTDATVQVIESLQSAIDVFISEPDNGIYDAMNKGILLASGDYLFFLNADDRFADCHVLEDINTSLGDRGNVDLIFGNQVFDHAGRFRVKKQNLPITRKRLARETLQHQTLFAKRTLFEMTNGFSLDYKVVSDYHWILKVLLKFRCTYVYLDRNISIMSTDGLSWTTNFEKERLKAMKPFYSNGEIFWWRIVPQTIKNIKNTIYRFH